MEQLKIKKNIRKEVHSRCTFAYEKSVGYFNRMKYDLTQGNIMTCKATMKFIQARRIYVHYQNEFQRNQLLPLSK